jgi:uncharacterized protein with GYD domain
VDDAGGGARIFARSSRSTGSYTSLCRQNRTKSLMCKQRLYSCNEKLLLCILSIFPVSAIGGLKLRTNRKEARTQQLSRNGYTVKSRYLEVGYLDLLLMSISKADPQTSPIHYHCINSGYLEQRYLDFRAMSTSFSRSVDISLLCLSRCSHLPHRSQPSLAVSLLNSGVRINEALN